MTTVEPQSQQGFEERMDLADDEELITALENHQKAIDDVAAKKNELADARKHATTTEDIYQALLKDREMPGGAYRAGRFVVEITDVEAHQRYSFEVAG